MSKQFETTSKFLSLILRHQPELIGLTLDKQGWADVSELIELTNRHGRELDWAMLKEIVATNSKKRFAFDETGTRIRASQGHSIDVILDLAPVEPPLALYHGTATRFLDSIRRLGLIAGSRRHVHLSAELETAVSVGKRHGKPTVLTVRSLEMHRSGHEFYISENGVWLTHSVPVRFLDFEDSMNARPRHAGGISNEVFSMWK